MARLKYVAETPPSVFSESSQQWLCDRGCVAPSSNNKTLGERVRLYKDTVVRCHIANTHPI